MYHIKEDKRAEVTAQMISDALIELILDNKWQNLTITALVQQAQVGRATFYRSFDEIQDVLQYQVDKAMDQMFHTLHSELHRLPHFYEIDLYTLFFSFWHQHNTLIKALLISDQRALFNNSFKAFFFKRLPFVQKTLGIQDAHWPYFVVLRTSVFSNGLFEWIAQGKKESPEEISKVLLLAFSELHRVRMSFSK